MKQADVYLSEIDKAIKEELSSARCDAVLAEAEAAEPHGENNGQASGEVFNGQPSGDVFNDQASSAGEKSENGDSSDSGNSGNSGDNVNNGEKNDKGDNGEKCEKCEKSEKNKIENAVGRKPFRITDFDAQRDREMAVFTHAKKLSEYIFVVTEKSPIKYRWNIVSRLLDCSV